MFPPRQQTGPLMFCRQERWVVFFAFRNAGKLGGSVRLSSWARTKYTRPAARRFQAVAAAGPILEAKTRTVRAKRFSAGQRSHRVVDTRVSRPGLRVWVGSDAGGGGALHRGFASLPLASTNDGRLRASVPENFCFFSVSREQRDAIRCL